jgi:hypothetical protein
MSHKKPNPKKRLLSGRKMASSSAFAGEGGGYSTIVKLTYKAGQAEQRDIQEL